MAFDSLLDGYSRLFGETALRRNEQAIDSPAVAFGGAGDVYPEQAFRHFLELERIRSVRSQRTFFLLLVSLRRLPEHDMRFSPRAAASVLQGLALSIREVDFIGWYRDQCVAGAVLTQGFAAPNADAPRRIVERVAWELGEHLPQSLSERLRVRVVKLGSSSK